MLNITETGFIFLSMLLLCICAGFLIKFAREEENNDQNIRINYELTNFYLRAVLLIIVIIGILLIMFATNVWILPHFMSNGGII